MTEEAPLCACGCGQRVSRSKWKGQKWRKYASRKCFYSRPHRTHCSKCGALRVPTGSGYLHCTECERASHLRRKYGLERFAVEQLLVKQQSLCAICSKRLTRKTAYVDHDHATGRVRGLLCQPCNSGLGWFKDNVAALRAAASYVEAP